MSLLVATQITAAATAVLALFAIVTALFAFLAFRKQSAEVGILGKQLEDQQTLTRQEAELLKVQSKQLDLQSWQFDEQGKVNTAQARVLGLQAEELRKSLDERRRAQASRVFIWQKYVSDPDEVRAYAMGTDPENLPTEPWPDEDTSAGWDVIEIHLRNSSDNPITATDFHVDIENSRETIHGFPRIRAEISFDTNPQGGLSVVGHTSSFPSVEIYHDAGASTVTVYTHEQAQLAGAAALGIPALDQSFGINVTADGFVDRAY
jgi:hypothetical protein